MRGVSALVPVAADSDIDALRRAARSLRDQTEPPTETVFVTNQSLSPALRDALNDLSDADTIHVHAPGASGLGGALRVGVERCSEPLVARLDADDVAAPERLERQRRVLTETPTDIVGSQLSEFRESPDRPERTRRVPTSHDAIAARMAWRCPLNHPTVTFKREAVLDAGNYRPFPMMEDWDLWARCLAAGCRFRNLDTALVSASVDDLAARRGGWGYVRAELRMARELRQLDIASPMDTVRHLTVRIPPRLLPAPAREYVYRRWAR